HVRDFRVRRADRRHPGRPQGRLDRDRAGPGGEFLELSGLLPGVCEGGDRRTTRITGSPRGGLSHRRLSPLSPAGGRFLYRPVLSPTRQIDVSLTERRSDGIMATQTNQRRQTNGRSQNPPPVQRFRAGRIQASVWEHQGDNGPWFSVTFTRSYKDGET